MKKIVAIVALASVVNAGVYAQTAPAVVKNAENKGVSATTQTNTARAGSIKVINGDVRAINTSGERVLKPGDVINLNDQVVTGKDSAVSMVLRDGTTMVLSANSSLRLESFVFDATTQQGNLLVQVLQGSMRMITGLIAKVNPEAVNIKTKTLTVGVRGTDFIVNADDS